MLPIWPLQQDNVHTETKIVQAIKVTPPPPPFCRCLFCFWTPSSIWTFLVIIYDPKCQLHPWRLSLPTQSAIIIISPSFNPPPPPHTHKFATKVYIVCAQTVICHTCAPPHYANKRSGQRANCLQEPCCHGMRQKHAYQVCYFWTYSWMKIFLRCHMISCILVITVTMTNNVCILLPLMFTSLLFRRDFRSSWRLDN